MPHRRRILLQLALDRGESPGLLGIARAADPFVDWIEAGTPWILAEGLGAVRELRRAFPGKPIVADVKIADAGAMEAAMAFAAGANMVTVLGLAGDATLKGAVAAGERFGGKIFVDLIHIHDPARRARQAIQLGASGVVYHVAHDDWVEGSGRLTHPRPEVGSALVIAGGLQLEDVPLVAAWHPVAIVIGRAITEATDPSAAARAFREALDREMR